MVEEFLKENGIVRLIDPNKINTNLNQTNAIPNYEDMHIFVELSARRRGRTIIMSSSGINKDDSDSVSSDEEVSINLMGINQDKNDPNYGSFTTKWHDVDAHDGGQTETFGITDLTIKTNTSFIPQVNIEFTDIRGYSFFDNEKSPYRIIFDFPPPLFTLKVKGYYGKSLTYLLHLVKYSSEFSSDTGNFVINAEFVAITFAPLADVLFRYIVNFPLMDLKRYGDYNINVKERPENTFDLILKLKSLYHEVDKFLGGSNENRQYDLSVKKLNEYNRALIRLNEYKENTHLTKIGTPYLVIYTEEESLPHRTVDRKNIEVIGRFNEYNKILAVFGEDNIPINLRTKLYLCFYDKTGGALVTNISISSPSYRKERISLFLKSAFENITLELDDIDEETKTENFNIKLNKITDDGHDYLFFDLTETYIKFFKKRNYYEEIKSKNADILNEKINQLIKAELGMVPTIYNIFNIILNDVDKFFYMLRKTSQIAEEQHNSEFKELLISSERYKDTEEHIYPFPLIIDKEPIAGFCEDRQIRSSPIILEKELSYRFPEMDLVDGFINSFKDQNRLMFLLKAREKKDDSGQNIWIPLTPLDSEILARSKSPYAHFLRKENPREFIYDIFLKRYYILTQYCFGNRFGTEKTKLILQTYAEAEAANLATSILESKTLSFFKADASSYKTNINIFYDFLEDKLEGIFGFENIENFTLSNRDIRYIYLDKTNENFIGLNVTRYNIEKRGEDVSGEGIISDYLNEYKPEKLRHKILNFLTGGDYHEGLDYTTKNLFYLDDYKNNNQSRYFYSQNTIFNTTERGITKRTMGKIRINFNHKIHTKAMNTSWFDYDVAYNHTKTKGNYGMQEINGRFFEPRDKIGKGAVDIMSDNKNPQGLSDVFFQIVKLISLLKNENKDFLYNVLLDKNHPSYDEDISMVFILSAFGNIITPFNNTYNETWFSKPLVARIPKTVIYYLGCLGHLIEENKEEKIHSFITGDDFSEIFNSISSWRSGWELVSHGYLRIAADLYDVKNNLSKKDKTELVNIFRDIFKDFYYDNIRSSIKNLVDEKGEDIKKSDFDSDDGKEIINCLGEKTHLLVHSDKTFNNDPNKTHHTTYVSIKKLPNNKKEQTDYYFEHFFRKLHKYIEDKEDKIDKQEREFDEKIGDNDIRTQTYYSFKNINDRWLSGIDGILNNVNKEGYPFATTKDEMGEQKLINSFVFVDRTMSPIGDTIIDPEILLDILESPDTTIFTALSQILSINGFEFFPLQNFMTHLRSGENDGWVDSFKIDVSGEANFHPVFVCMYIGGASSYPTGIHKEKFKNDGIVDLLGPGVDDFSVGECSNPNAENPDDLQRETNPDFPFRQVNAFRVRFGEQDQSMFTDIKIEGNEFPETNESIQILSRIAGDNKMQAPIPKGQNLYNLYENRAYSSTITTFGNVMIQPSQYYQLENVPLFNGAYIILNVEHHFKPNHAVTTFEGTKILKYPIPRVKEPYAVFGFEGGTSSVADRFSTDLEPGSAVELMNGEFMGNPLPDSELTIRNDTMGHGRFGSRRDGGRRNHEGVDFIGTIGDKVVSPIDGKVNNFFGSRSNIPMLRITPTDVDIREEFDYIEILYVIAPDNVSMEFIKYRDVKKGQKIGYVADLRDIEDSNYTNDISPHIHVQIFKGGKRINPEPFFSIVKTQPDGSISYLVEQT